MDNHDYSITDQVLLARISEGDALAFERLFEKYHKKLGNYLLHFTSSAEEAKELIQEVFLRIWEKRDSIASVSNFDHYLYRIAHNLALDLLKMQKQHRQFLQDYILLSDRQYIAPKFGKEALLELVEEAVAALPAQQKKVYLLNKEGNKTQADIAMEMGLSIETVKKHKALAIRFIRAFVHPHIKELILLLLFFL